MNTGEEVFVFFNDTEKNNELAMNDYFNYKSLYNNRKFQISYVQINKEELVKRSVLVNGDNDFMLRAKSSSQINTS